MASDQTLGISLEHVAQGGGIVAGLLLLIRYLLGLAVGTTEARLMALERERDRHRDERDELNNRVMAVGHALSEVMAVLERHDTENPALLLARSAALARARTALAAAFPLAPGEGGEAAK